jgi:hypothetical protein
MFPHVFIHRLSTALTRQAEKILMRRLLILLLLIARTASAQGTVSDSALSAAIADGLKEKKVEMLIMGEAGGGFTAGLLRHGYPLYSIFVEGPLTRTRNEAATHAQKYMPYTIDSVGADARSPYVFVRIEPAPPRVIAGQMAQAAPITHVILRANGSKGDSTVVQPVHLTREPMNWGNAYGASYSGEAVSAVFDSRKFPPGDISIVVIYGAQQQGFPIKHDERALH